MVSQTDNNSNPTDFGTTGETGSNPNDVPATPIDNYLNILFTVGISYVFFIIVTSKKNRSQKYN